MPQSNKSRPCHGALRRSPMGLLAAGALVLSTLAGCSSTPEYGLERKLVFPGIRQQRWAVAPALNLSGQRSVDPLLQADLVFQEVAQVEGLIGVPVNRVVEVMAALGFEQIQNPDEAALICEMLDVDGLIVPTVTMYDPYDPPKFGAALQLFFRGGAMRSEWEVQPRDLTRSTTSPEVATHAPPPTYLQVAEVFDAAEGSTRQALWAYADGRSDPLSAAMEREYLLSMDRYCTFGYASLLEELLNTPGASGPRTLPAAASGSSRVGGAISSSNSTPAALASGR